MAFKIYPANNNNSRAKQKERNLINHNKNFAQYRQFMIQCEIIKTKGNNNKKI